MLNYLETRSIASFKEDAGSETLEIKRNNKTNKFFFVCGQLIGAVSSKAVESDFNDPVISQVESEDTGEIFYLLHSKTEGGATRLATL